jgi:hypothetical protein
MQSFRLADGPDLTWLAPGSYATSDGPRLASGAPDVV